ncbi:hypothetical protein PRIPAC_72350 [Pristionchus pacificus]|uniref:Uncharacterized protein n=1 Tax=Pristionchus pacificus TaxID=54126 RepID=A0A2A6BF39_PRIPA|nr:hypothetical protein PRIPAC_72350 [Pristionchus pacificus]|eukprot:PDM64502.1 hypothetical protein PRIPAC_52758 [Pristionchus pacificus]
MNRLFLLTLLAAVFLAESAPLSSKLQVLFINDFTLNFLKDDAKRVEMAARSVKCLSNAYPDAAEQFAFTSAVVDAIDGSIDLTLQYDYYRGGNGNFLNNLHFTRDDFSIAAGEVFRDFCFEGPQKSDLSKYVHNELFLAKDADVLVLFTAAPSSELAAALPLPDPTEFKSVIVVGLDGADASAFYPDTSISIADFTQPDTIASMINAAYADIQQRKRI